MIAGTAPPVPSVAPIAGDDQIGALDGPQRASQRPAGLDHVRAVQVGVEQVHAPVGAHRQRLADGPVARSGPAVSTVTVLCPPAASSDEQRLDGARSLISSSTASAASWSRVQSPSESLRSDHVSGTCLIRNHDVRSWLSVSSGRRHAARSGRTVDHNPLTVPCY